MKFLPLVLKFLLLLARPCRGARRRPALASPGRHVARPASWRSGRVASRPASRRATGGLRGGEVSNNGRLIPGAAAIWRSGAPARFAKAVLEKNSAVDSVLIALLYFGSEPAARLAFDVWLNAWTAAWTRARAMMGARAESRQNGWLVKAALERSRGYLAEAHGATPEWESSIWLVAGKVLRRLGQSLAALYALELLTAGAAAAGVTVGAPKLKIASILLGATWCAQTGSLLKRWALGCPTVGPRVVWNRLLDFALGAVAALVSLELVARELQVTLGSIVAVGGFSGIVVALAAKEPLSELLNGLVLALSSKFAVGDDIRLDSGLPTQLVGTVTKLGWFDTHLRGPEETTTVIPNSKILKRDLVNMSQGLRWGQYRVSLRIRPGDLAKLPAVISALRDALAALPAVVVQPPLRPLSVQWREFAHDNALVLVVDLKLKAPYFSSKYWELRERINFLIAETILATTGAFELAPPTTHRIVSHQPLSPLETPAELPPPVPPPPPPPPPPPQAAPAASQP